MKKTLIALAALAMASAANAAYTFNVNPSINWPSSGSTDNVIAMGDFNFNFTIHSLDDVSTSGTLLATVTAGSSAGAGCTHLGYVLTKGADNSITLTVGRGRTDGTTFSFWPGSESEINAVTFTNLTTGVEYNTRNNVNNSTMYAAVWANGSSLEGQKTYNGQIYNGSGISTYLNEAFDPDATPTTPGGSGGTESVPEPTTATLSLLALAGLAARRRRK